MREAEEKRSERIRAGNSKSVGSGRIYIAELNIWQSRRAIGIVRYVRRDVWKIKKNIEKQTTALVKVLLNVFR